MTGKEMKNRLQQRKYEKEEYLILHALKITEFLKEEAPKRSNHTQEYLKKEYETRQKVEKLLREDRREEAERELEKVLQKNIAYRNLNEDLQILGLGWKELCIETGRLITPQEADELMFMSYAPNSTEESGTYLESDILAIIEGEHLWVTYHGEGLWGGMARIPYNPERIGKDITETMYHTRAEIPEEPKISIVQTEDDNFISYLQEKYWRYKRGEIEVMEDILRKAKEIINT